LGWFGWVATAWLLLQRGHRVCLVDPIGAGKQTADAGTGAALGLLMAQVYRRSSGRGWRLRQRSLQLWQQWGDQLAETGPALPWRPGLLQLAADRQELEQQQRLVQERTAKGFPLRLFTEEELAQLRPHGPAGVLGGLFSPLDGQLDPIASRQRLLQDALSRGLELVSDRAEAIAAGPGPDRWRIHLAAGSRIETPWLLVCAGMASGALLEPLGHQRPLAPVLGQALELQLPAGCDAQQWPGSLVFQGINLVPRPGGRLWLGATLEPDLAAGDFGDPSALDALRQLNGHAPDWLRAATPLRHWYGLRAGPRADQPPCWSSSHRACCCSPATTAMACCWPPPAPHGRPNRSPLAHEKAPQLGG
jgi:D-amino-acid oxidase